MEKKLRTKEEVYTTIREKNPDLAEEALQALTTLNLSPEEQLADLRKRYPSATKEALQKYAKDDETIAHSVLDTDIELGMWESMLDDQEESEAEKAASRITDKFHSLISKSIWGE